MLQKIIILDFEVGKTYVCPFDKNVYEDGEHFIVKDPYELGIRETNCQWMIVDELEIKIF